MKVKLFYFCLNIFSDLSDSFLRGSYICVRLSFLKICYLFLVLLILGMRTLAGEFSSSRGVFLKLNKAKCGSYWLKRHYFRKLLTDCTALSTCPFD